MLQLHRTRIALSAAVAAALIAIYALLGFVVAPRIVRHALLTDIPRTLGVRSSVGAIRINPFLLQAQIEDFALTGKDGGELLGFGRLFVDFDASSIWHRAYTFERIEITAPRLNAVRARDGTLNLAQLAPPGPATAPQSPAAPLPPLRVRSFKVTQGSVRFEDHSRPSVFSAHLTPIDFELKDFATGAQGGMFTLSGATERGERLQWRGHVSVQPIESDGELRIEGLRARTLWEYAQDRLNFVIDSGQIDAQASYRFALQDTLALKVNAAQASLTDLTVSPRGSPAHWVSLAALTLSGVSADLAERRAEVDSLALSGLNVSAWLEPGGAINLMQLAAPAAPGAAGPAPPPAGGAGSQAASGTGPAAAPGASSWRVALHEFALRDASIAAEDRTVEPAAKVTLAPLSLELHEASLDLAKPVEFALDTRVNGSGSIALRGVLTPRPAAAKLDVKLSGLDLTAAQPYIAQRTAISLRSGRLGGDLRVRYGAEGAGPAALEVAGTVDVENLHTVDDARRDDLIRWRRLTVRGLEYRPDRLEVAEARILAPYARVIIEPDATLNVTNALKGPGSAPSSGARPAAPDPAAGAPVERLRRAPVAAGSAGPAAGPGGEALAMSIKKVLVQDGRASFTDLSVSPNFSAEIQSLDGSVIGLSSRRDSRAKVDLHGAVDAFSPVSIQGEVNLLGPALYTDLAMDFKNIELSIFNPYSGKFAGYNISKGKLTTELHYKIDGRKLDAQHHVVIDQLEFGAKTASKDAVSLPVKLAVALLKDRHGVIDLELPVTGSLDDPKFRLGPIIWKVFVNILEKAVTAPFALLGSLFGGGPDLEFIDFKPGASVLDAAQTDKVKAIVKALNERPQLKIEVPIAAVPAIDRPALASAALDADLRELQAERAARRTARTGAPTPVDQLEPAAKLALLAALYAREVGGEPEYPQTLTANQDAAGVVSAKIEYLTTALLEHSSVGADRLKTLAEQRALAVQQALLTGTGIDPGRVFLVANDKASAKDGLVRCELSLR